MGFPSQLASESEGASQAIATIQPVDGGIQSLAWLLIALPLAGAAILLLGGRRTDKWGHLLALGASWSAFILGALIFFSLRGMDPADRARDLHLFTWVPVGTFNVDAGLLLDPLSVSFVLLVTFVGSLIHVYSVAYMEHDANRRRFFAYLNLFVAAMLLLVLADSYLLLYVGWEGVGLASYLLIGFWNHVPEYATAAKKAFVVNRVGDMGLSIAVMLMFVTFGTVSFAGVFAVAGEASEGVLTAIGLALLLGAAGKSAQFPLQSWLGDAMAGPTPVSALIHAATMVTAGVYLVVRSAPVFNNAPTAQLVVVIVGTITLVMGAVIGMAKDDIKKALAASTMSQIGYMLMAAGLGPVGYAFAILHLLTHGFFKAGMFLGAGSVMHGMNDSVQMRTYGGLSKYMKVTWITFGLGWLAILGIPPFSGFFSKDKIIEAAFVGEGIRPWIVGTAAMLAAGLTAFYMSRLFFMTFHGQKRWNDDVHPHESPKLMTIPMIILAFGSVFLGGLLGGTGALGTWLTPVIGEPEHHDPVMPWYVITVLTLALVAAGTYLAYRQYAVAAVPTEAPKGTVFTRLARRDLGQDDFNEAVFMAPGQQLTKALVKVDTRGIDAAVDGLGSMVTRLSGFLRLAQTGFVRSYVLSMVVGVVAVVGALVVVLN